MTAEQENRFGGPWTREKLEIVQKYLNFYTRALQRTPFRLVYIDAFAGNGYCTIKEDGGTRVIRGSATIAMELDQPFDEIHLLEADEARANQLRIHAATNSHPNVTVHTADCNEFLPQLLDGQWRTRRAVLFLDPYGLNIDWQTVAAIGATKAIDVLFLVSISGVYRNAPKSEHALDQGKIDALNRFLGTDAWQSAFYEPEAQRDLFSEPPAKRVADWRSIARFIQERLCGVFAGGVNDPVFLFGHTNAPLFALYFAVANPSEKAQRLARRVAREIMEKN